jgi:hypothetical protein
MFGQITEITPRSYIASGPVAGCSRTDTSLGPLTVRLGGYSVLDLAPDRREARRDADVVADRLGLVRAFAILVRHAVATAPALGSARLWLPPVRHVYGRHPPGDGPA